MTFANMSMMNDGVQAKRQFCLEREKSSWRGGALEVMLPGMGPGVSLRAIGEKVGTSLLEGL